MKKVLVIMDEEMLDEVYDSETQKKIKKNFDLLAQPSTRKNVLEKHKLLKEVEVIFSGWGGPIFDEAFLAMAPNLEAVFYAAGSMKKLIPDETIWNRNITVATANAVNAIPVAEYTISQILFSLKNGWQITRKVQDKREYSFERDEILGGYKRTIGLVSLSQVGRKTLELLKPYDLNIVVYDPFVSYQEAEKIGVNLVSLEELFKISDVVSLHSPLLPETRGMITGKLLSSMKKRATFINTARGAIVAENDLIDVFEIRKDLTAILDVTNPEPPASDSKLYDLDNIVLTPHIAGSLGSEVARMGATMVDEAVKYVSKKPMNYQITKDNFYKMA